MDASTWTRLLPYVLVVATVGLVVRSFFEDRRMLRRVLAVGSCTLMAALIVSIGVTFGERQAEPETKADAPTTTALAAPTSTTVLTGTAVPASVQGAVEERADYDRIVACETALAQIAAAIRESATAADPSVTVPADAELTPTQQDSATRLQSCQVRLKAIAATLPG